jgi:hypothetical protein
VSLPDSPPIFVADMRKIVALSVARVLGVDFGAAWGALDAAGAPLLVTWDNEPSQNSNVFIRLTLVSNVDEAEPSEWTDPATLLSTIRVTKRAQINVMCESTEAQIAENVIERVMLRIGRESERLLLALAGVVLAAKPIASTDLSYDDREDGRRVSVHATEIAVRYNMRETDTSRVAQRAIAAALVGAVEGTAGSIPLVIQTPNYPPGT